MTCLRRSLFVLPIAIALAACGGSSTTPGTDAGGASDMNANVDGNVPVDGGVEDGSTPRDDGSVVDAGGSRDMCVAPRCPPIPVGCRLEASADPCMCGVIKCDDAGVPGATCGGRAGPCGPGLYCEFTVMYDCGFTDGTGTCMTSPDACTAVYAPVCGCDGVTYSNACSANAAGASVAADGECATASDCRTTGCAAGSHCDACLTPDGAVYACIPDGAAC